MLNVSLLVIQVHNIGNLILVNPVFIIHVSGKCEMLLATSYIRSYLFILSKRKPLIRGRILLLFNYCPRSRINTRSSHLFISLYRSVIYQMYPASHRAVSVSDMYMDVSLSYEQTGKINMTHKYVSKHVSCWFSLPYEKS